MAERRKRRPRDPIALAKLVGDIATGQVEDREDDAPASAAVEFARRGGLKGGRSRAEVLTPERRKQIAEEAARARWHKEKIKS